MTLKSKLIYFIFGFIVSLSIIFFLREEKNTTHINEPYIKEIIKDSIIRDSIYLANDSIITKIEYIEKEYNEEMSNIMSNSDSINFVIFSEYIKDYNNQ